MVSLFQRKRSANKPTAAAAREQAAAAAASPHFATQSTSETGAPLNTAGDPTLMQVGADATHVRPRDSNSAAALGDPTTGRRY